MTTRRRFLRDSVRGADFNLANFARFVVVASKDEVPAARERTLRAEQAQREKFTPSGRDLALQFRNGPTDLERTETDDNLVFGMPVGTPDQVEGARDAAVS